MDDYDWSRFTISINVKAPTENLYNAWATRFGMELWFLRLCEYQKQNGEIISSNNLAVTGDKYKWLWHGWPDDVNELGEILDCNGVDLFKFSFGKAGSCTVRLKQEEGDTIVELTQQQIPVDEAGRQKFHLGCKTGWTFYLANLKSIYEGGIDLRNKNVKLQGMLNS
ncbi:MAG: SRPBCC domain-containing protein [Ginsengibacter sp.]